MQIFQIRLDLSQKTSLEQQASYYKKMKMSQIFKRSDLVTWGRLCESQIHIQSLWMEDLGLLCLRSWQIEMWIEEDRKIWCFARYIWRCAYNWAARLDWWTGDHPGHQAYCYQLQNTKFWLVHYIDDVGRYLLGNMNMGSRTDPSAQTQFRTVSWDPDDNSKCSSSKKKFVRDSKVIFISSR